MKQIQNLLVKTNAKTIQQYTQNAKHKQPHKKCNNTHKENTTDTKANTTVNTNKCNNVVVHTNKQNAKHNQPHITTELNANNTTVNTNK